MKSKIIEKKKRILIYDFHNGGHCPGWLYLVVSAFAKHVEVILCCQKKHPEVSPWVSGLEDAGLMLEIRNCDPVNPAQHAASVALSENINRIFFPNFDSLIYSLGRDKNPGVFAGLDIGGIWLRPNLIGQPQKPFLRFLNTLDRTRRGKLKRQQQRAIQNNRGGLADILLKKAAVANLRLFFTSIDSAMEAQAFLGKHETKQICDPWITKSEVSKESARKSLGIPEGKTVFLHAGTSRPEKGLRDVCEAMLKLETGIIKNAVLLRAGKVAGSDSTALRKLEAIGSAIILDRYVSEEQLTSCYAASDWVLLPYRNQKESSGILIHAAANSRPVIASNFGLIAANTLNYELGELFEHLDTNSLYESIKHAIIRNDDGSCKISLGMKKFAEENSPDEFQRVLNEQWLINP